MPSQVAAVILAAGKGTRMKSDRAKVLHPIAWRPMVGHVLDALARLAPTRTLVVVGHEAAAVREAVSAWRVESVEQVEQRGTGHAVLVCAEALRGFQGTVLVLPGDVPLVRPSTLDALLQAHAKLGAPVTVLTCRPPDPTGYGRIVRDPAQPDRIARIVEHKDASSAELTLGEINSGLIAAEAGFLFEVLPTLVPANRQKEIYLTDIVGVAASKGTPAAGILHEPAPELEGVNDRAQLARVERALFLRVAADTLASGVTVLEPESARIDPRARIGADSVIGPRVEIRGATVVGEGSTLETGSILEECVLGKGVTVRPYCVMTRAKAGEGCVIGPYSHLRPETELAEGVHVGNFVEVKKSSLGKGTKANHLSYLGDAKVGSGVNVGAGTITCNYDGYAKHPTEVGDGVFIGSDTALVAPVKVGKDAVIGAGSTITKEVPEGALALTRAEQVTVPGYSARRRARAERAPGGGTPTKPGRNR